MIVELGKIINSTELNEVIKTLSNHQKNTTVFLDDFLISPLLASSIPNPFVYVVHSREGAEHAGKVLSDCGRMVATILAGPDMPIYSQTTHSDPVASALARFLGGMADVLVIVAPALLACVPKVNTNSLTLEVNKQQSQSQMVGTLIDFGYAKVQTISRPGDFSVRGDIIDVWAEGQEHPVRFMFSLDTIEAIKRISIETFLSIEKLTQARILPITTLSGISPDLVRTKLSEIEIKHDNINSIIGQVLGQVEQNKLQPLAWLAPFVAEFQTILEAIGERQISFVFDRPREVLESLNNSENQNISRLSSLIEGGLLLPIHTKMFGRTEDILKGLERFKCVGFSHMNSHHTLFNTEKILSLKSIPVTNYFSAISILVPDIVRAIETLKKTAIIFVGGSKALSNYLTSKGVEHYTNTKLKIVPNKINVIYQPLSVSFEVANSGIVVYSVTPPSKHPVRENMFQKSSSGFIMPQIGEVVVHEVHGLGRYLGIKKLKLSTVERDYIVLQYDGGAFVYLPPEQTGALSNYQGEPTRLSRIGGKDFAEAKQRVRRRLKELSFKLSKLYAKRSRVQSNIYEDSPLDISQFRLSFHHNLTSDQEKALDDIRSDMLGNKVMDRLICGDVGFGKTEVALHAAFRAVLSGYQVALLCPTTILSVQHGATAKKRLEQFGIRVEVLNRFVSEADEAKILRDLKDGKVDIVVGTHRLLSGDVAFKNLSLLILDEEQRFGVAHKEKIKQLKNNIDVLTLSATPIPRTLNMALIGIRDISNITTPPVNRVPVITYVTEYSDALLVDAISREVARGGQTLVLFNNVETIYGFAAKIRKMLSGLDKAPRVGIVHGQMTTSGLEEVISDMYGGKLDVLVASTIIENGIDISTANTLVVIDADRLGVAQMHQLRGRVGRGDVQAFAYFTYAKNKEITEIARERLVAIQNFSGYGSGMNIAMRDLQLRGAGDLLGASQSGHMEQIGFDMYCKILREVTEENQTQQENNPSPEPNDVPETVLDISLDCFIPHEYVENETERMKVYRAISEIKYREDCDKILAHLGDLYGKIPPSVKNIVLVGYIRLLCKGLDIKLVKYNREECVLTFYRGIDQAQTIAKFKKHQKHIPMLFFQEEHLRIKIEPSLQKLIQLLELVGKSV